MVCQKCHHKMVEVIIYTVIFRKKMIVCTRCGRTVFKDTTRIKDK